MSNDVIICCTKVLYTWSITLDIKLLLCIYENVEIWINLNDCIHWHIACLVSAFYVYNEQFSQVCIMYTTYVLQHARWLWRRIAHSTQHTTYCIMYTIYMLQCVDTLYNHWLIHCYTICYYMYTGFIHTVWWIIYSVVLKRNMSVNNYCIHL